MRCLVIFPHLLFLIVSVFGRCPPQEKISPCECEKLEDFYEVTCTGKDVTLNNVKNVLNAFDKSDTIDLLLHEMNLGSVPSDFFAGYNIRRVELEHCDLVRLSNPGERILVGLEDTLEELEIIKTYTLDTEDINLKFNHLRNLLDMELSFNAINEIGNDCFPDSLTVLYISSNGIEKLGDRAFANLNKLESLYLEGSRFGAISRSMLPDPANYLEDLMLDNNAFTSIPEDLFTNMPVLKTLSIKSNAIRKIEEHTFKRIWTQMEFIDAQENPLECYSHIDWMINLETELMIAGKCNAPHDRKGVNLQDLIQPSNV